MRLATRCSTFDGHSSGGPAAPGRHPDGCGGGGRDILIGRTGVDGLFGGDDDDLLFDGTTSYDLDPAGLASIQDIWLSAQSYSARLVQLRSGALNPAATTSDSVADQLFGESVQDWFWANLGLDQTDRVVEFEAVG